MPSTTVSREDAEDALNKIWNIFKVDENKTRLMNLVKECDSIEDPQKKILVRLLVVEVVLVFEVYRKQTA